MGENVIKDLIFISVIAVSSYTFGYFWAVYCVKEEERENKN